jgi:hypothetical protein
MIYRIVMLWLIFSETLLILSLMKGSTVPDKLEASIMIAGFFVIGILLGVAI